jgi:predicted nicotinamide N-methyase
VDAGDLVRSLTRVASPPLLPEISLHLAEDPFEVWAAVEAVEADAPSPAQPGLPKPGLPKPGLPKPGLPQPGLPQPGRAEPGGQVAGPPPFWAFAWAGGQALARHVLDHPDLVAGRRVLDLASGSGLVAVAAAMAGAARVVASDVDPLAAAAISLNAGLNGRTVEVLCADVLADRLSWPEVVLAGDVCYEVEFATAALGFLRRHAGRAGVLIGDPHRAFLPPGLTHLADYAVPGTANLEERATTAASVYTLREES